MKPETRSSSAEASEDKQEAQDDKPAVTQDTELTDEENLVFNLLKANSPIDLNDLKGQTGLSNKKWDKAIKGLTKNRLARVEITDAGLLVSLV